MVVTWDISRVTVMIVDSTTTLVAIMPVLCGCRGVHCDGPVENDALLHDQSFYC